MKTIVHATRIDDVPYVQCVAVIAKSVKRGVPRRYQRSWKVPSIAPQFTVKECGFIFFAEAERWKKKVMATIAKEQLLHQAVQRTKEKHELVKSTATP